MIYDMNDLKRHSHQLLHAIGRHHGRPGGGRGGGGFMGGGPGFPGARRLTSADLQLVILALLAERPAHGYELIKMLEERSGGFYTPSPGMIYPALTYLDEIGHAQVEPEGTRKLYRITDDGSAHLAGNRAGADAILAALSRIGGRMDQVREAFAGVADPEAASSEALHRARHALRHALSRKLDCSQDEALRIAAILDRATAEILGH